MNIRGQIIGKNNPVAISDNGGFLVVGLAKSSNSAKLVLPFFLTEKGNHTYPFLGHCCYRSSDLAGSVSGLKSTFQGVLEGSIVKGML